MEWQSDTKQPIGCASSGGGMEMLPFDLFDFGYFPRWLDSLDELEAMAQPEPWAFPGDDPGSRYNTLNPLLERYINSVYTRAAALYNEAGSQGERDQLVAIRRDFAAFDTGLVTPDYAPILAYFARNTRPGERRWYFKGWATPGSHMLARAAPLPKRVPFTVSTPYNPAWPVRVNTQHMIQDEDNLQRIPPEVRNTKFLALLLESAVELARRQAAVCPELVVPQYYQRRIQYLLPICLTDPERPDLAMTLQPADGYYIGSTMLTLRMAYTNARVTGRRLAPWLAEPMKGRQDDGKQTEA